MANARLCVFDADAYLQQKLTPEAGKSDARADRERERGNEYILWILFAVHATTAAESGVVDLKSAACATRLAAPAVALEHGSMQFAICLWFYQRSRIAVLIRAATLKPGCNPVALRLRRCQ